MSKKTLRLWSVLLSVFLVVSMIPTMVFAGNEDPIEIIAQPEDITAQIGEEATMSVVAENVASYQWQRSADGQTWSNISATNVNYVNPKTDTLTVKVNKNTITYVYRCTLKNSTGSVSTDSARVNLQQQLEITTQPSDISGTNGEQKTMSVVANNATSYQWQRSSDGESWSNIGSTNVNYSNAKTSTLTIKISKTTAGFVYRCVATNSDGSVNSDSASVTLTVPLTITAQPVNVEGLVGEEKTMSVVAQNATSYQWQRSSDGQTWSNVSTTNVNYGDAKTDTLIIKINKTTDAYVYRCIVKNSTSSATSDPASVTITEPAQVLEITAQPEKISGEVGEEKTMSVVANNATSYQWQRSADGQTWSNISTTNTNYKDAKTATLTVKINKNTVTYVYRCVVKNAESSVNSESASATIAEPALPLEITEQPESVFGENGEEKTMSVVANNATSYQWQRSTDGETWSKISATNVNYSGADTDTLTIKINKTTKAYVYRCVVKNDDGESLASESAQVMTGVTVTFDANGGYFYGDDTVSKRIYTLEPGTELAEVVSYYSDFTIAPVRAGYAFEGWYFDPEFTEDLFSFWYPVNENVTFYAKWSAPGYTVTWNAGQGNVKGDKGCSTYTEVLPSGQNRLNHVPSCEREGYIYDGWYLDEEYTNQLAYGDYDVTGDVTFYARWTEAVNVTWNANGGYVYGDIDKPTYTESKRKNAPVSDYKSAEREGYSLVGWYYDSQCTQYADLWNDVLTGDVTLYAKWEKTVYITWDANGGTIDGEATYIQPYQKNAYLDYYQYAYRDGYIFDGWYLDAECNQPLTDWWPYVVTENVTFYVKWAEAISVTWNANGGYIWGDPNMPTYTQYYQKNDGIYGGQTAERYGYSFDGWYYDEACTSRVDFEHFVVTENVTFYAKWDKGCEITWDCCGGYYVVVGEVVSTWKEPVSRNTLLGGYIVPSRDGYVLEGWYLDSDYEERVIFGEYVVTQDVTFYAKWAEAIYVTWDANGGTIWGEPTYIDSVLQNTNLIACSCPTPERNGYAFDGWCLDEDCTELVDRYDYVVNENVTFYAKWVEAVYITWDFNGGYVWPSEFTYLYSETTPIAKNSMMDNNYFYYTPQRDGYVFAGWCLDAEGTENVDLYNYYFDSDVTFYAKWRDTNERVNVTWNANGGCFGGNTDNHTYTEQVEPYSALQYYKDVSRAGYIFDGWYFDADCTEYADITNYWTTEDVTFYANWAEAYTVTWNGNGGVFQKGDESFLTNTTLVRKNQQIDSHPDPYPTRTGYVFEGWYLDANCTEKVDTWRYRVDADVTLYANWIEAVSVTWNAVGGCLWGDTENPVSIYTESCGKNQQVAWYASNPVKDGYVFDGWYLDSEYEESVDVYNYIATEDVTFYAKWSRDTQTYVTSITCTEPLSLLELVDGYYGADDSFFYSYKHSESYGDVLNAYGFQLTINYSDGTSFTGCCDEINALGYGGVYFSDNQLDVRWTVGGENYITVSYRGVQSQIPVTIIPNTVTGFSCSTSIRISEYTNGEYHWYNGDPFFMYYTSYHSWVDYNNLKYYDDFYNQDLIYTVEFSDRDPVVGNAATIHELTGLCLTISDDDQWTEHWYTGNTYYITANLAGYSTSIPVSIVQKEVESITCPTPLVLVENVDGHEESYWGGEYFHYDYKHRESYGDVLNEYSFKLQINYTDGTSFTGYCDEINALGFGGVYFSDDQEYNHWTVEGENYLTVSYRGVQSQIPVKISRNTVTSITCANTIEIVENTKGRVEWYNGEPFFKYWASGRYWETDSKYVDTFSNVNLIYTVEFSDREPLVGDAGTLYRQTGFSLGISGDDQWTEHWVAGETYYITIEFAGQTTTVPVTIIPHGVSSITCNGTLRLNENTEGYYTSDGYFRYEYYYSTMDANIDAYSTVIGSDTTFTISYSDGRDDLTGTCYDIFELTHISFEFSGDNQSSDPWLPGRTYSVEYTYCGVVGTMDVYIVPSASNLQVSSITCSKPLELLENDEGYPVMLWNEETFGGDGYFHYVYAHRESYGDVLNAYSFLLTINYTDGSSFTGYCDQINALGYGGVYFSDDQDTCHWEVGGENYITVSYRGVQSQIPVTIIPNTVTGISCSDSIQIVENTCGEVQQYNGVSFFQYYTAQPTWVSFDEGTHYDEFYEKNLIYTVYFSDRDPFVGTATDIYAETGLCLTLSDNQWTNHWTIGGVNSITASLAGQQTSIYVSIVASYNVTITWNAKGGYLPDYADCQIYSEMVNGGLISMNPQPIRDGYAFGGWYLDEECQTSQYFGEYVALEDVTFYAKWVEPVYVTWDANGGYIERNQLQSYTSVTAKNCFIDEEYCYRDGYYFDGWYLNPECTGGRVDVFYYPITKDVTFYAKWVSTNN